VSGIECPLRPHVLRRVERHPQVHQQLTHRQPAHRLAAAQPTVRGRRGDRRLPAADVAGEEQAALADPERPLRGRADRRSALAVGLDRVEVLRRPLRRDARAAALALDEALLRSSGLTRCRGVGLALRAIVAVDGQPFGAQRVEQPT
jgi:hypothetical protein